MNNEGFLKIVFGRDYKKAHVTSFPDDPLNISDDRRRACWAGGRFENYKLSPGDNQFFTISTFNLDEGKSRRRKNLFRATHVIVLDDVHEKIEIVKALKLPTPTYILETSPGSEQWGYVLMAPCTDANRVNNLLDGLVAAGMTQDGKDPGMKGVTRYVRLPEGYNTKKNKNGGIPFQCRLVSMEPMNLYTLEELAEPFGIDLDAIRSSDFQGERKTVSDHPIFETPIVVKEQLSPGRFDIVCPWVDQHTKQSDSGTAIFTNADGSLGFKCHHGHCEDKTARDLFAYIEEKAPGFIQKYQTWSTNYHFKDILETEYQAPESDPIREAFELLQRKSPGSDEARTIAKNLLKGIEKLSGIEKLHYQNEVADVMGWTKGDLTRLLRDLRKEWHEKQESDSKDIFRDVIFVREMNHFYNTRTKGYYSAEGFQNAYADVDPEIRKNALMKGYVDKVDRLDFLPGAARIFSENDISYGNTFVKTDLPKGKPGDCSPWLEHFDRLGWAHEKKHLLAWMAYTLRYPAKKINHIILLGGVEGIGKDFLLSPLVKANGPYAKIIEGLELTTDYHDYLLSTKYLHVNETELGDHRKAAEVSARIKPLAAAPPERLRVNQKNVAVVQVRNIVNVSMTTNSKTPLKLQGHSRRVYPLWSDFDIRDETGNVLPEWSKFWATTWEWMENGGIDHCIHYLLNDVDLTSFSPGAAPPVTEFLTEMTEDSKSPFQQTLEAFIKYKVGAFSRDLLSTSDAIETLKNPPRNAEKWMYIDTRIITPHLFGRVMNTTPRVKALRARKGDRAYRIWAVRSVEKYVHLSQGEVYDEYNSVKNFSRLVDDFDGF